MLGRLERKRFFLFSFLGGLGGCRYICSRSGRKKVQNIKRGNSQLENEHSSIYLLGKGYKQRSEALPTIYNLGLEFSNVVDSNSTFGLLGFGSTLFDSKCSSSEHSKNILQATARICCDLDGYTLGMIGMASTGHLGWKPMPANPTPISSDTAFTCINWPKSIAIST